MFVEKEGELIMLKAVFIDYTGNTVMEGGEEFVTAESLDEILCYFKL